MSKPAQDDSVRARLGTAAGRARVTVLSRTDLNDVARLFAEVWPSGSDHRETTAWAFDSNPLGAVPLVGAVDVRSGRVVGARGGIRWPLSDCLGVPRRVLQLHGSCVHPDYRRAGLFRAMTQDFVERVRNDGAELIFNVSVDAARAGYEQLGWVYIGGIRSHHWIARPLKLARRFARRRANPRPPSVRLSSTGAGPRPGFAAVRQVLENREQRLAGLHHTVYTEDVYDWRFARSAHRVVGSPELGYCVYKLRQRADLVDLLIGDLWPMPGQLRPLLRRVVAAEEPDTVTLWMSGGHPLRGALLRFGFLPNLTKQLNFGVKPLTDRADQFLVPSRWAFMAADIDTF